MHTKADALFVLDASIGNDELIAKVVAKEANDRIIRTDTLLYRVLGFLILHLTLLTARFYPFLRFLKKRLFLIRYQ